MSDEGWRGAMNDIAACTWMGIMPAPARNLFSGQSKERGRIVPKLMLAMELLFALSIQYFGKDRHLAPARAWAHVRSNAGALDEAPLWLGRIR